MSESISSEPIHVGSRPRHDKPSLWRQGRVQVLRDQVERRAYAVDSTDVAESIIDAALELLPAGAGWH
jgi:anti-sigma28 factor (negative regulator of flagellin synthesis)